VPANLKFMEDQVTLNPRALPLCLLLGGLAPLLTPEAAHAGRSLNDTALQVCLEADDITVSTQCSDSGQDAAVGRDVTASDDSDGKYGFSFVKVAADGSLLPASATQWSCVKDKVTGLLWEVKTNDGGLRDYRLLYTNHGDLRAGDSSRLVDAVNTTGLCGRNDWRLPDRHELQSLVDYGRASGATAIDQRWFPNSLYAYHWTGSTYVGATAASWLVTFDRRVKVYFAKRQQTYAVRLVNGSPTPEPAFTAMGDEVLDNNTGLIWKRCTEGQLWTGSTCEGELVLRTWGKAVDYAKARALETGVAWRLPNPKEIGSITDATRYSPPIDPVAFPNTPSLRYWTSSFDPLSSSGAFFANFQHGGIANHDRHRFYAIRLVRDALAP